MFLFFLWAAEPPEPALPGPSTVLVAPAKEGPADLLFRRAKNLRYGQRWYEAAALYRQILRDYPAYSRLPEVRFWLASTLESDQRWDSAAEAYTEFLNLHPDQKMLGREAKLNRIHCWGLRQGQNPQATPGLVSALGDPSDELQVAAALQLSKTGDRRAVEALQKGLKLSSCSEPCRLALLGMGVEPKSEAPTLNGRFLVLRIQEKGKPDTVTIRLAMGLAKAVVGYLSDAQIKQAKHKGVDPERLMDIALNAPKGTILLSVDDKDSSITILTD
ncbi:MAG: HEAT repeat domain-containing protein [Acidobacteriota bacterium]|nr:HEAT repeat domain-containing protein [Acidobacteriota bacterium]